MPGQDREEMQRKVETFVRGVLGQKPPSIQEILTAVLKQDSIISAFISTLSGASTKDEVHDDLETLFCSKLIAAVYKDVGLLGKNRKSSDFLPKHFSQPYDGYMDLQNGALLGPELPINFESVSSEIEHIQKTIQEEERARPEAVVRAISSLYMGLGAGLGGIGTGISDSFRTMERGLHGWSEAAEKAMARTTSFKAFDSIDVLGIGDDRRTEPKPRDETAGLGPERSASSGSLNGAPADGKPEAADAVYPTGGEVAPGAAAPPSAADAAPSSYFFGLSRLSSWARPGQPHADPADGRAEVGGLSARSGGFELRSGPIVDEVLNVHDGGRYSPGLKSTALPGGPPPGIPMGQPAAEAAGKRLLSFEGQLT